MRQDSLFSVTELNPVPRTGWVTPTEFPRLEDAPVIALDTETKDPELLTAGPGWGRGKGHLVGIAVGVPTGERWYFPMRHEIGGGNLDPATVLRWAKRELTRERQPKVGANLMYDAGWLAEEGAEPKGPLIDVQYAEALLNEHRKSYSLDSLAKTYLGERKVDEALYDWLWRAYGGAKGRAQAANIYRAPVALAGPYAEGDVDLPLRIWEQQKPLLEAEGLMDLMKMECALIPILMRMRQRGSPINEAALEPTIQRMKQQQQQAKRALKHLVGFEVDPNINATMVRAFEHLGLSYKKTAKGNPSFTRDFLEQHPHEIGHHIREIRRWEKYLQYAEGYRDRFAVDGVIHGSYHPLRGEGGGTVVGRFSSCLPDDVVIATKDGDRPLRDVHQGDHVWTHCGAYKRVLNKWFTGNCKTFRITLESGKAVECTSNHRLLTTHGWLSLEDIHEHLHGAPAGTDYLSRHCRDVQWAIAPDRIRMGVGCGARGGAPVFAHIRTVEYVGTRAVYDLEVEDDHSFLAGGVYVHNSNPNLTNIPARDPAAKKSLRGLFAPWPGERWRSRDYSQIQFRIMVHYGIGQSAEDARARYAANPHTDYHDMALEMVAPYAGWDIGTPEKFKSYRKPVKNINFALAFTGGVPTLVKQLGKPKHEVEELLGVYHGALPFLKQTSDQVDAVAQHRGYIKGILGRRHRFPLWAPKCWALRDYVIPGLDKGEVQRKIHALLENPPREIQGRRLFDGVQRANTHLGLNRLAQDGEGSTIKAAMVACWEAGIYDVVGVPLNTVHDEINHSDPGTPAAEEAFREMKHIMETVVPWKVPLLVGDEVGPNWADLTEL